jgi:mRNA interferase RelE/StbE
MKTRVDLSDQVRDFVRSLAPDPRKALRLALHGLETERGDIKPLEGDLSGYHRLRVGGYRVVFRTAVEQGHRLVHCICAEKRSIVYELFAEELKQLLAEPGKVPRPE